METAPLIIITGGTACGKSALGIRLAQYFGGEILSCDSVQIYRGMDIGSAKVTTEERALVPHYGLDVVPISEKFDVTRFEKLAKETIRQIQSNRKPVFIVGGTGFYLKSFYAPISDDIVISETTRQKVREDLESHGLEAVANDFLLFHRNRLGKKVFDTFQSTVTELLKNPHRLARYWERCLETGKTLPEIREEFSKKRGTFDAFPKFTVLVERDPEQLEQLVKERVTLMLQYGLIDEVRTLLNQGLMQNPAASRAIGYREVIAFLEGKLSAEELPNEIVKNTKKLLHKQRTWFRHQIPVNYHFNLNYDSFENLVKKIEEFFDTHSVLDK